MDQRLGLTAELALWLEQFLSSAKVNIVWKRSHHHTEGKLEDPFWEIEDSCGPVLGDGSFILPHSHWHLSWKAGGVCQPESGVLNLDLGLDTGQELLPGSSRILLHQLHHHLVGLEHDIQELRLTESDLCSDSADTRVAGEHV